MPGFEKLAVAVDRDACLRFKKSCGQLTESEKMAVGGKRLALCENLNSGHKKWQDTYIAPLQPYTLAAFPPWGILQELVV